MPPEHFYFTPATPGNPSSTLDVTPYVRLGSLAGLPTEASLAGVGSGGVTLDDPDGALDFVKDKQWYTNVPECPAGRRRLFSGYTGDQSISRGPYREESAGRQWSIDIVDLNAFLHFRVIQSDDGASPYSNRPAETAAARLTWWLGIDRLSDTLYDEGLVQYPTDAMDAANYQGQYDDSVLNDLMQATGMTAFVHYHEATGHYELFFDKVESTAGPTGRTLDSDFQLSNVLAECDWDTIFPPTPDAKLSRGGDIYAGVYGTDAASHTTYRTRVQTSYDFGWRDGIMQPPASVKTLAKLQAYGDRMLTDCSKQTLQLSFRVYVPPEKLTILIAGERFSAHLTHLPGLEADFTMCRAIRVTPLDVEGETTTMYYLDVEATVLPPPPGNMLVMVVTYRHGNPVGTGPTDESTHPWTLDYDSGDFANGAQFPGPGTNQGIRIYHRSIVAGESATVATLVAPSVGYAGAWVYEIAGADPGAISVISGKDTLNPASGASAVVSATASGDSVLIGGQALQKVDYGQVTQITSPVGTNLFDGNMSNTGGGTCGVTADGQPPHVNIGYATGSGSLSFGGTVSCTGASPDYNLMGRGRAALLIGLVGTFSIVQSAHGSQVSVPGDPFTVTLPSPPSP